jgi:hypothetical protein
MDEEELPPEVEEITEAPVDDTEPEEQIDDAPPSLEDLASRMGWTPKEKWRGDPDKWKPADQFISATADINSKLANKLTSFERQMEAMARTSAQITEQALAKQKQELLALREDAWNSADKDTFDRAEQQLKTIEQQQAQIGQAAPPEVQDFVERNKSWFNADPEATNWAMDRAEELARQGIGAARQIQIVEREAKGLFPEFFEEKSKPKSAPLNQPGARGVSQPTAKSFAALPKDAQAAALQFERAGRCTKEQYAKMYFEEEA